MNTSTSFALTTVATTFGRSSAPPRFGGDDAHACSSRGSCKAPNPIFVGSVPGLPLPPANYTFAVTEADYAIVLHIIDERGVERGIHRFEIRMVELGPNSVTFVRQEHIDGPCRVDQVRLDKLEGG